MLHRLRKELVDPAFLSLDRNEIMTILLVFAIDGVRNNGI